MCEEPQFDFGDFNLKFLELSPPRPTQGLRTATPLPKASTLNYKKLGNRVQDLAKRIANNDALVQQLKTLEKEQKRLHQQLKDFQSSAKDISALYEAEKIERQKQQRLASELYTKCETLSANLASITLSYDQLSFKLEETNHLPVDYNDLSTCYMRLYSKLEKDQAQHWHDQAIADKIRKYCVEKSLFIPEKRSPKKRKPKIKKPEIGIQCELGTKASNVIQIAREMRSQGTQYMNVEVHSQGTQHISTTTTRSTCTTSFIKKHNVGTCFPEPLSLPPFDDMLCEMLKWDIKPVSPIPNTVSIVPEANTKKSTGTCTFICNIQKAIDYIGNSSGNISHQLTTVKQSNSRPPSRNMIDRIKNEVITPPLHLHPFEQSSVNRFPQVSSSLNELNFSTFDDLWQVFGQMLFGLLKNRNGEQIPLRSHGTNEGNPINQHDFQNWLRSMYEEIAVHNNTVLPVTQTSLGDNLDSQDFRNKASTNEDEIVHHSIGTSPIRFHGTLQDFDSSLNVNEEFAYPAIQSTIILSKSLPKFDGEELSKIHISAKTKNNTKNRQKKKRKLNKNSDAVVKEILSLFSPLECTEEKKLKILKLLKNQNSQFGSDTQENENNTDSQYKTLNESPSKLSSENAVDFLTQLGTHFSEKNISPQDLPKSPKLLKEKNQINAKFLNADIKENFDACKTEKKSKKETTKLVNSLFGSDSDDSELDEANKSSVNITAMPNTYNKYPVKKETFTNHANIDDNMDENSEFNKETESCVQENNNQLLSSTTNGKNLHRFCQESVVNESQVVVDNDVDYLYEINENNLIIDEFYDVGLSQIEIPTDFTVDEKKIGEHKETAGFNYQEKELDNNCKTTSKSSLLYSTTADSINRGERHEATISPIIDSTLLNEILTTSTNEILEDILKIDALSENMNNSCAGNQLQSISLGNEALNSKTLPFLESKIETNITPTVQNSTKKRGNKRKIDFCKSPTTLINCKRSERLKAKQMAIETCIELTPLGKKTRENQQDIKLCDRLKSVNTKNEEISLNMENNFCKSRSSLHEEKEKPIQSNGYISISFFDSNLENDTLNLNHDLSFHDSPASPPPPTKEENNTLKSSINFTKEIPLEIDKTYYSLKNISVLQNLCKNYNNEMHRIVVAENSTSSTFSKEKEKQLSTLNAKIEAFLSTTTNEIELDVASFVLVQHMQTITKSNIELIALAIVDQMKNVSRPENELDCKIADVPQKYLSKSHRKISYVMRRLQMLLPQFSKALLCTIEKKLFNFKETNEKLSLSSILNLTQLYLLTISNQLPQMQTNPARLFIYKCLYFHNLRAVPMIYEVLCCFPTTLPHREDRTYDHSDVLITTIQHILMCTKYDMNKEDLRTKELLSKLRFEYHFEPFKPDRQEVLNYLLQKIKGDKSENISYAFALLCKRMPQRKIESDVLQAKLMPLANEYYSTALNSSSYDAQVECILETISMIVKPFALDTDISIYLKMFARFLNAIERPVIQEAAAQAILRMQRFGCSNCYYELLNFKPRYELQPITRAMLQTFLYRKPLSYWKQLNAGVTIGTE